MNYFSYAKGLLWPFVIFSAFFLLLLYTTPCRADWIPYVRADLEQIYDSNIFLEPEGESRHESRSDFRTNISSTLGIRNESEFRVISLEYTPTYSYFVKNTGENYLRHTTALDLTQGVNQHVFIYFNDSFDYSEEPVSDYRETESTAINYGRRKNIRNSSEGGLAYRFGQEDFFRLYYSDERLIYLDDGGPTYGDNRDLGVDDSVEYGPGAQLVYWINQRNGVNLIYEWQRIDYEIRESRRVDHLDIGYSHRWSPHAILRTDYILDNVRTFGRLSPDYKIHQFQAGIEKAFSPSLTTIIMAGFYHRSIDESQLDLGSSNNNGFNGHLEITYNRQNWNVTLAGEGGVRLEFNDYNNRGFTPYRLITIDGRYDFTDRLHGTSRLSYVHEVSPDTLVNLISGDHRTETYNVTIDIEYLLREWLTCSFEYTYNDQSETQITNSNLTGYNDHVFMLRFSASYDWLEHEGQTGTNSWQIPR